MATPTNTHPVITIDLVRVRKSIIRKCSELFLQILDRLTTKDVLQGVLHSILFHRLFGTVKPQTFEVLDVTMVCLGLSNAQQIVVLIPGAARSGRCGNGATCEREGRCVLERHRKRVKQTWSGELHFLCLNPTF